MGALGVLFLAALAPIGSPTVGARIAASAVAAQNLQGPLDGTWTLSDATGRALFIFQIVDPVTRAADPQAAWREPGADGRLGVATTRRFDNRLYLRLGGRASLVNLRRVSHDLWRGVLRQGGLSRQVILRRG